MSPSEQEIEAVARALTERFPELGKFAMVYARVALDAVRKETAEQEKHPDPGAPECPSCGQRYTVHGPAWNGRRCNACLYEPSPQGEGHEAGIEMARYLVRRYGAEWSEETIEQAHDLVRFVLSRCPSPERDTEKERALRQYNDRLRFDLEQMERRAKAAERDTEKLVEALRDARDWIDHRPHHDRPYQPDAPCCQLEARIDALLAEFTDTPKAGE